MKKLKLGWGTYPLHMYKISAKSAQQLQGRRQQFQTVFSNGSHIVRAKKLKNTIFCPTYKRNNLLKFG